ncbi:thyroid hormone receptor-associated protein 3-like isoform X2 [Coregonus clupeaformis]|uniref:thyroid hormone receptor-associated protein 3-like isoform X2 n=1 Tax=Coregonus clupeaformis TaxID=59861 RepID=UPI001BDFED61|nr:thyroid hormone receptor-associated protein 3-like isoform X2 [Coregonus clupeaformis]
MSKATKSASKSRSHSRSRSRSRSVSRSRSSSRSRSRKHRYSSRSRTRSRSRSHSPSHNNRERNYPREYQNNNREFRGYHRGFRRPYYFRGRGRGYFPRGRFQRGGGGGYNNNYRPNNWQNYRQHPQQQQQQQQQQHPHPHSPRRGRSRTPKKRSGSPRSHSHSKYSDRSSSPRSRRSRHSSSSHSSSPTRRSGSGSATQNSKDVKEERSASKEVQKRGGGGGGGGGGDGEPVEITGGSAGPDGGAGGDKPKANWQGMTDHSNSTSPKRSSPQVRSAVIIGQGAPATTQASPSPNSTNANGPDSNGAPSWQTQTVGSSPSTKSPSQKSPTPVFSGFGVFSKEDNLAGDKAAMFKRFLEVHNHKKKQSGWENGREMETNGGDVEREKGNGMKSSGGIFDRELDKGEKEKYKYREDFDDEGNVSLNSFLKATPFFSCDGEEEDEEMILKPRPKVLRKDRDREDDDSPKLKSKVTLSARKLFEERFGKWEDLAYLQVAAKDDDLDAMAEEIYRSRKQEKAAAIAAALAKREAIAGMLRGFSPDNVSKGRRKEKAASSPSPTPPPRRNSDREMFMVKGEDSPPRASGKRGAEFSVRMDSLRDDVARSSGVMVGERRLSRELVHPTKKEQGFHSIFQHIQATELQRSPLELFSQHIVTIVHYIKAQHFPSNGITLNERFAMYQRRAAEKEMMKPRKSPEIHRRIDVSPSAFKKHSHLFEGMKNSGDGSYKDEGKNIKGDSMDLRLDIERRKKYSTRERDYKQDGGRDSGDSPEASRERSAEKSSKHHKKSKGFGPSTSSSRKNKKKRSRSRSSSSSSSAESHRGGDYPHEGFNKARLGPRGDYGGPMERGRGRGGFQFRIRGRGWNRGNYQGNNTTNGNPPNMDIPVHPKNEDWDPEYTPKSRKYYLHDDREGERKWVDNRGRGGRGNFLRGSRGRFIIRKATVGPPNNNNNNSSSPKWTHDKFQVNGGEEEGEPQEEDTEQDHKDQEKSEDTVQ